MAPNNVKELTRYPAMTSIQVAAMKKPNKAIGADIKIDMGLPSLEGAYRKMKRPTREEPSVANSIYGNPPKRNKLIFSVLKR
jgi:hypothetical protein